ncbi:MAG: hypothetical protein GY874_16040 [Desulfobacteraceae bacterium]|nr:hypothetical protein [Desulfobacteraceae bacterium]
MAKTAQRLYISENYGNNPEKNSDVIYYYYRHLPVTACLTSINIKLMILLKIRIMKNSNHPILRHGHIRFQSAPMGAYSLSAP